LGHKTSDEIGERSPSLTHQLTGLTVKGQNAVEPTGKQCPSAVIQRLIPVTAAVSKRDNAVGGMLRQRCCQVLFTLG
jgi:hypothetical protein